MRIIFNNPIEVVAVPEVKQTFEQFNVKFVLDNPNTKQVIASIEEIGTDVILWQGDTYDAIGQWTDTDVVNRINELYPS